MVSQAIPTGDVQNGQSEYSTEVQLIEGKVCRDHVHKYVEIPPKHSILEFMSYLKEKGTLMLFDRHTEYRKK